jgi:FKBP-type peptidyl-prolyl cis-trans isomerase
LELVKMLKIEKLIPIILLAATAAFAQNGTTQHSVTKKAPVSTHSASTGPTKVTGDPTKTADGLEYWDIKVGTGAVAQTGQTVKVHYTGWLTTGKKFDSSVGKAPLEVTPLGNAPVIKGWNEGIVGMKVGGKRQLRIPPELAYGADGYPGVIPANSTLIFDVQLMAVQ